MAFPPALPLAFRTTCLKGHRPQTEEAHHMVSLCLIPPRNEHLSCPDYSSFFLSLHIYITYVTGQTSEQGHPLSDSSFAKQSE